MGSTHAGMGAGKSRRQTTMAATVPTTDASAIRIIVIEHFLPPPNGSAAQLQPRIERYHATRRAGTLADSRPRPNSCSGLLGGWLRQDTFLPKNYSYEKSGSGEPEEGVVRVGLDCLLNRPDELGRHPGHEVTRGGLGVVPSTHIGDPGVPRRHVTLVQVAVGTRFTNAVV